MKPIYCKAPANLEERLGEPGQYPFTRGIYPKMYSAGRYWTMRQYAGFGSAKESNERYKYLLSQGTTGLSVAFDLPTQLGLDPDNPLAKGEVGKVGVSIANIDDMALLFDEIPLDKITTSMTINAPAMMLLALYILVAEQQGIASQALGGTIQNDILKEYVARGTYIYPPQASMRLVTDIFEYCAKELPRWNTISISGYHIRESGSTAAQEIAFTIANAKEYVRAALSKGLDIDQFAPRLSFFFASHNNILEEAAKFRAARRIWANIMKNEFKAQKEKSLMLRFHSQTGGSTLTAQQPENNIVRTAYQALAAVLGGTQSLHTNAMDEALGLPTAKSARIALRTQQILAYESGIPEAIDPLAGSYYLEHLTDSLEEQALELIAQVENFGGSVKAIEANFIQNEIEESAYQFQKDIESKARIIVGVNKFISDDGSSMPIQLINPELQRSREDEIKEFKKNRNQTACNSSLKKLGEIAQTNENIFPYVLDAFRKRATLGEINGVLRAIWGEYSG